MVVFQNKKEIIETYLVYLGVLTDIRLLIRSPFNSLLPDQKSKKPFFRFPSRNTRICTNNTNTYSYVKISPLVFNNMYFQRIYNVNAPSWGWVASWLGVWIRNRNIPIPVVYSRDRDFLTHLVESIGLSVMAFYT